MANTYLLNDTRLVVVDPGSELNVRLLQEYLFHFLQRSPAEIDLIVLTHLHPDHTAGVDALRRICSAPVAASSTVTQLAHKEPQHSVLPLFGQVAEHILPGSLHHLDLFPPAYHEQIRRIDLWLEDRQFLPGHPAWMVLSSPGHTPESLCLFNAQSRELLCGDTVITLEGGAPLLRGGSNRRQLDATLRLLRSLPVCYLYPGHGRPILATRPLSNVDVEW